MEAFQTKKWFSTLQLIMLAVISVDSLRNLPIGAQYGLSLVTFYLIAGVAFFLPLTWIASQLATRFPVTGGSYVWVEAAFGKPFGRLSIWLQWSYNIIWYPTIFAFISSTLASLVYPDLENNRWFILITCICLFWLITSIHTHGVRAIAWISTIGAVIGTLLPMFLIICLACYWLFAGSPSATTLSFSGLIPDKNAFKDIAYFSNILFSLVGIEVIAMHAGNVQNPQKSYPRALIVSAFVILVSLILSSLALCIVMPPAKIMLLSGIMDVFKLFFSTYNFPYGAQITGWCIIIGGLGIASSWMISIARGLHTAFVSGNASKTLQKLNKNDMPLNILYFQGIIYTVLLSAFILLPNINNSYWLLSALASQFSMLYYILLFSAAFKLFRPMRQDGKINSLFAILLPISGGIMSLAGILVGFIPPSNVSADHILQYELFMISGVLIFCILPLIIIKNNASKNKIN